MSVNAIDLLIVVAIVLSLLNGYRRGFVHGILDLAGWALSLIAALRYYQPVARWLGAHVGLWSEVWNQPIAFVLIAVFVSIIVHLIGHALLKRLPKDIQERRVNQIFGLLPGFINGLILAAIISALLMALPLSERLSERTRDSVLANRRRTLQFAALPGCARIPQLPWKLSPSSLKVRASAYTSSPGTTGTRSALRY